jgi:transposase
VIQITPQMSVLVATEATDFRRGIDGLAERCRASLHADPFAGIVFVFCNRSRTAIKLLVYDGQGFWLCHKRLSAGKFRWWPSAQDDAVSAALQAHELQVLLSAGDPSATRAAPVWRAVDQPRCSRRSAPRAEEKTGGLATSRRA